MESTLFSSSERQLKAKRRTSFFNRDAKTSCPITGPSVPNRIASAQIGSFGRLLSARTASTAITEHPNLGSKIKLSKFGIELDKTLNRPESSAMKDTFNSALLRTLRERPQTVRRPQKKQDKLFYNINEQSKKRRKEEIKSKLKGFVFKHGFRPKLTDVLRQYTEDYKSIKKLEEKIGLANRPTSTILYISNQIVRQVKEVASTINEVVNELNLEHKHNSLEKTVGLLDSLQNVKIVPRYVALAKTLLVWVLTYYREYEMGEKYGEILVEYCNEMMVYNSCFRIHEAIGICQLEQDNYSKAVVSFYKMLISCFYVRNVKAEFRAYGLLSQSYFELGDLQRSKFFHIKQMKGDTEPEDSMARKLYPSMMEDFLKMLCNEEKLTRKCLDLQYFEEIPFAGKDFLKSLLEEHRDHLNKDLNVRKLRLKISTRKLTRDQSDRMKSLKMQDILLGKKIKSKSNTSNNYNSGYVGKVAFHSKRTQQSPFIMYCGMQDCLQLTNNKDNFMRLARSANRGVRIFANPPKGLEYTFRDECFNKKADKTMVKTVVKMLKSLEKMTQSILDDAEAVYIFHQRRGN